MSTNVELVLATGSSVAGIITACSTVLLAIGGVISALTLFIPILRATRETKAAVAEVHTIVNQQRTDAGNYQRALIRALTDQGIEIPIDQSITPLVPETGQP